LIININSLNLENFNISIFKKKELTYLYVYNTNYYTLIKISKIIKINIRTKNLLELLNPTNNNEISLKSFIKQFRLCEFTKIKFTGKGYKIKKNTKHSLILLFNRAHITTIWWKNIFVKKLKKYKVYIRYMNMNKNFINTLISVRPINIFTKKGLRKSRQILLKKKGKK